MVFLGLSAGFLHHLHLVSKYKFEYDRKRGDNRNYASFKCIFHNHNTNVALGLTF